MPQTAKEQDRTLALDALAADHRVTVPLDAVQRHWLAELVPHLPLVPARMHGGLIRYILAGVVPGDFLAALLTNDLIEAVGRADDGNRAALPAWVRLLIHGAPGPCFGSRAHVVEWVAHDGLAGIAGAATTDRPDVLRTGSVRVGGVA